MAVSDLQETSFECRTHGLDMLLSPAFPLVIDAWGEERGAVNATCSSLIIF